MAQDSLEHAHHHGGSHDSSARLTRAAAVLVAAIAAVAVVVEMSANDRQTAYLAHDVAASDLWSQYQGKSVRRTVMEQSALLLEADAEQAAGDAARAAGLQRTVADARAASARLESDPGHDGMRQIAARAAAEERDRDQALELHEKYERSVRGLQISIVLIGLFMATRLRWLLGVGSVLGGVALVYGVLAGIGLV